MSVIGISAYGKQNMSNNECCHIEDCHMALISNSFQITHGIFVACLVKSSFELKARDGFCVQCKNSMREKPARKKTMRRRIFACLFCKYFGCLAYRDASLPNHIRLHAENKNHYLAMNIDLGFVLCFKCHTIIHDPVLEKVAWIQKKIAVKNGLFKASFISLEERNSRSVKSKRGHSKNQVELKQVEKTRPLPSHSYEGLRNFSRLGQSCYMASVLQAIIHAPFIAHLCLEENYPAEEFLSKEHKKKCLSCELRNLVCEIYSGETKPLTFRKFYQIFFMKSSSRFKPDEQEDASWFLRELLNIVHQKEEQESKCGLQGCVLNEAFAKKIDSKTVCEKCNYEKKINDQSRDIISLCGENPNIIPGVTEALRRWSFEPSVEFTCVRPCDIHCDSCDSSCKSRCDGKVARLKHTITQLPEIFVFHVQKFSKEEVTSKSKESKKSKKSKEVFVLDESKKLNFENTLDMASFMPSQNKCQNSKYYLFAVIEHELAKASIEGEPPSGHYVAYIKTSKWFKFDDLESSNKKIENYCDISKINPFLLFYHRGL